MNAADDSGEPRGWLLAAMLLVGGVGLTGVFVPFVPAATTKYASIPLAIGVAYGLAWLNAVAADRRRGRPDPRERRLGTIVFGTILLLFAWYALAMTLPFAWTTAVGTPGRLVAELHATAGGGRHRTCDYRLKDGVTGWPGTIAVCVDGGTYSRWQDRRPLVAVSGPRTAFGQRIDDWEILDDLGPREE